MFLSLLCLATLAVAVGGEPDRRLLLEDNYYAIVQRLNALESKVTSLEHENGNPLIRHLM